MEFVGTTTRGGAMTLQKGWLGKQFAKVAEEIKEWPDWMRREAGFQTEQQGAETNNDKNVQCGSTSGTVRKDRPQN